MVKKKKLPILILILLASAVVTAAVLVIRPTIPEVKPSVGVIEIRGYIESEGARDNIVEMIEYAIKDANIKAVVLKIDSPGGCADATEEIYMDLLRLRDKKPVVSSIVGYGVSGGYYIAIASDFIFAAPSAMVGNIGVIGRLPYRLLPSEEYIETGPYKWTGFSEKEFPFKIQMVLEQFLRAVETQRENRLRIDRAELSKGMIYFGVDALKNGLIDNLGSSLDAIEKASTLAGIEEYEIVGINLILNENYREAELRSSLLTLPDLDRLVPPPAFHYVYIPTAYEKPRVYNAAPDGGEENVQMPGAVGANTVLVDFSHNNAFYSFELNVLLSELVQRDHNLRYLTEGENLEKKLENVKAFVVVIPLDAFSDDEIEAVKKFVGDNGKLLLITDPTREFSRAINSLAADFGIVFANGYLYNVEESYGNYRNIYLSDFKERDITKNIEKIVLFTAAHIYSKEKGIAFTSERTFSSEGERGMKFSPIAFVPENLILAIGDFTFLTEPYCYVENNFQLISNIADFLTSG